MTNKDDLAYKNLMIALDNFQKDKKVCIIADLFHYLCKLNLFINYSALIIKKKLIKIFFLFISYLNKKINIYYTIKFHNLYLIIIFLFKSFILSKKILI